MADSAKTTRGVLAAVGGKENVTKVYDETLKLGVGGGAIDVDAGDLGKFEWTPKNVGNVILNYLSKTMVGIIPIMMGGAFFRVIATVVGPLMLNVWAEDSQTYQLFYTWMYDAAFYFMPVLAQVEKLMKKVVPDVPSTVFVPFLIMLDMLPIAYCVLAPLGNLLGDLVGNALFAFGEYGRMVEQMADGKTYVLVFHPGYLDAFILGNSSLTVNRTKEVDALIDPELRAWLEAQGDLRLITYRDL